MAFVAQIKHEYGTPLLIPVIVIGLAGPDTLWSPPGPGLAQKTVYRVIGDPLSDAGALNEKVALPLPGAAETDVGAVGMPAVTGNDADI